MKNILLCIVIILFTQCVEEDFFGLSSYGEIKSLEVSNQASQAVINSQEKTVKVEIPAGVDLTSIKTLINGEMTELIDLPGIYNLNGYSEDEEVVINFIENNKIDHVFFIMNAS